MYGLTDQQFEIVKMIAHGYINKQIAAELHIPPQTVHNRIAKILKICHAKTRAEIVSVFVARFLDTHRPLSKDDISELYEMLGIKEKETIAV